MPPLPETRDDINLEGQWGMTAVNQPFLQHQDNNMILLATDNNLEMLASADTVFMDGTFTVELGKCCAKVRRMLVSKSIIGDVGFKMKLSAAIFLRIVANIW
jgi:hypothetical protein